MIAFIDDHHGAQVGEPIQGLAEPPFGLPCRSSQAVSARPAARGDEDRGSARLQSDFSVYGVRKVARSGASSSAEIFDIVRSTVSPLMRDIGLQETIRGKPVKTSSDKAAACQQDYVNRQFQSSRPNALWHSDFTYLATWTGSVYVAFVIGAYARSIVGWRA